MDDFSPDMIPEKYHVTNEETGDFNVKESMHKFVTSYNEFGGRIRQNEEQISERLRAEVRAEMGTAPDSPDQYTGISELGDNLSGLNVTVEEINSDPMMKVLRDTALAMGVSDERFALGQEAFLMAAAAQKNQAIMELEQELGSNYQERMTAISTAVKGQLGDEEGSALLEALNDVKAVKALESLVNAKGVNPDLGAGGGDAPPMSIEDLQTLQKDPRYWRDHDPVISKQVSDGYAALDAWNKRRTAA